MLLSHARYAALLLGLCAGSGALAAQPSACADRYSQVMALYRTAPLSPEYAQAAAAYRTACLGGTAERATPASVPFSSPSAPVPNDKYAPGSLLGPPVGVGVGYGVNLPPKSYFWTTGRPPLP